MKNNRWMATPPAVASTCVNDVPLLSHKETSLMTYLTTILDKYKPNAAAPVYAKSLAQDLQRAFPGIRGITYSGSYAKGTAVSVGKGGSDVDLFLSFSPGPLTLQGIYEDVYQHAKSRGWNPRKQNVSIGLQVGGFKVDLVPARQQGGYQNYHSLYVRKAGAWRQTNIQEHINRVGKSQRTQEIRALKIWRTLHGLEFPSFYLELFALQALKWRAYGALESNVWHTLGYIQANLVTTRVIDPANTNNLISDSLSLQEKRVVAAAAAKSRQAKQWREVLW